MLRLRLATRRCVTEGTHRCVPSAAVTGQVAKFMFISRCITTCLPQLWRTRLRPTRSMISILQPYESQNRLICMLPRIANVSEKLPLPYGEAAVLFICWCRHWWFLSTFRYTQAHVSVTELRDFSYLCSSDTHFGSRATVLGHVVILAEINIVTQRDSLTREVRCVVTAR
jgi:hypothetical protein